MRGELHMTLLITPDMKISTLVAEYPFLIDFLPTIYQGYDKLKNPFMRKTLGKIISVGKAAEMGGFSVVEFISIIQKEIEKRVADGTYHPEDRPIDEEKIETLRNIIKDLHAGGNVDELKKRFNELIEDVSPVEIPRMEQKLIDEGMPQEEITRLSSLHVQIFKEALEAHEKIDMPPGHPIHTFMKENAEAEHLCGRIMSLVDETELESSNEIHSLLKELSKINFHYLRKENQLFPRLEAHNISGPTQVMWTIHDEIRASLKEERGTSGNTLMVQARDVVTAIRDMIFKEESILFPLCRDTLTEAEWVLVKEGEHEIGYSWIEPEEGWTPTVDSAVGETGGKDRPEGFIPLDTGLIPLQSLNLMLKHLPVDIQFVDQDDFVAYYSDTPVRIFPRSPGVIGREVRKCHPPKSVEVVSRILEEFKEGTRDDAEFWITLNQRFLYIKYIAVRDDQGAYVGTLEVSQDITELRKLEGQKRLLDWN